MKKSNEEMMFLGVDGFNEIESIAPGKKHQETEKHYSDTYDLVSRYKIDGNPLRNYIDAITIEKYVPLLQI